jgi:hypothetical protein
LLSVFPWTSAVGACFCRTQLGFMAHTAACLYSLNLREFCHHARGVREKKRKCGSVANGEILAISWKRNLARGVVGSARILTHSLRSVACTSGSSGELGNFVSKQAFHFPCVPGLLQARSAADHGRRLRSARLSAAGEVSGVCRLHVSCLYEFIIKLKVSEADLSISKYRTKLSPWGLSADLLSLGCCSLGNVG